METAAFEVKDMGQPEFRFGQEDLRARSLEPAVYEREYYLLNQHYGSAEILRQYAGLPSGKPVPWAVQAVLGYQDILGADSEPGNEKEVRARKLDQANLPYLFTIDGTQERRLRGLGIGKVCAVGSMFHYARDLHRRSGFENPVPPRRGTIALPDKSDLGKLLDFDRERYAEKLAGLPAEFQPVYVSMHWRDFARGCHEPYLRAGLKTVCSGHPYEPVFYQRFYDVCRRFKYSCSNEISTSFALSVLSGCQFFFFDGGPVTIERTFRNTTYQGPEPGLVKPAKKICIEASPFPPVEGGWSRQRELAGIASGEKYLKPPEFFQQAWEPARTALSDRLTTATFRMSPPPAPSLFANWLPSGFDSDGWADSECSLEVPARAGFSGVELELTFPLLKKDEVPLFLRLRLDGDPASESQIPIDRTRKIIFAALRDDGARRKIEFAGLPALALPGELRARCFRLVKIEWRAESPPAPKPAGNSGPKKAAVARGRTRKWWAAFARIFERRKRQP